MVLTIPIWFYSNSEVETAVYLPRIIYIPIWFYSNISIPPLYDASHSLIYIPIWFYSNDLTEEFHATVSPNLHSNLVLF